MTNEIPPGVIIAKLVTSKHGSRFRLFYLDEAADSVHDASSTGLTEYDPFRSAAPEGVHLWEVSILDPELSLGGSTLILKGVADQHVIDLVEVEEALG